MDIINKKNKFINFFIREPERKFHIRQLAKLTKKSPTTISKYLKEYEKKRVLISERKLNHLLFKANNESEEFKQLKLSYNLNLLKNSGLVDFLIKEFNNPEAIVLFGSFAKAENTPTSDIDVVVISPLKKEINIKKFEKKLKHKIQLFITSRSKMERMKKRNKELLNNWINGLTLYGIMEVFR